MREKDQADLTDNKELLNALMDGTPLCLSLWNHNYEIMACNNEVLQLFELTNEKEYIDDFLHFSPEYQPDGARSEDKAKAKIDEAFANGRITFGWSHCKRNGDRIPTEVTFSRIPFQNESIVVGYTRDMRLQLAQEEQNRRFNTRLKGLLDASPLCLNLWNRNYENTMCNKEAMELFEVADEKEYMDKFFDLSPEYQPDGRTSSEKAREKITEAFEAGKVQFLWTHCKQNGELIPAEITLVRIAGLEGEGEDMVAGYTRDLRPQLLAEKLEKIASLRIKAVLDATPLSCLLWSLEEEILDCNQIAVEVFGAESKQDLMQNFMDYIPEYQPDGTRSVVKMKEKFQECREESCSIFEWMYTTRDHEDIPCEVKLVKLLRDSEADSIVAYSRDLRELRKTLEFNEKLVRMVNHDVLTGCYSRAYFMERLDMYLQKLISDTKSTLAVFLFDIDDFKNVNDTYGHDIGDITLKNVVKKAAEVLPRDAETGRFGGDEFLIMIRNRTQAEIEQIAHNLTEQIANMELSSGKTYFHVTISVGIVLRNKECQCVKDLVKQADSALYEAKKRGKNCAVVW